MAISPGTFEIGPSVGSIRLRTYRQGVMAKAGHDLLIEARSWHGTLQVPEEGAGSATVEAEIDLRELEVLEGTGGVKPLSSSDKGKIRETMHKVLGTRDHPTATFTSTKVSVDGDHATLEGDLVLAGRSHPLSLQLVAKDGGAVSGTAELVQSAWGVKPYVGFFGALKLKDAVEVEVSVSL